MKLKRFLSCVLLSLSLHAYGATIGFQQLESIRLEEDCRVLSEKNLAKFVASKQIEDEYDVGTAYTLFWLSQISISRESRIRKTLAKAGLKVEIISGKLRNGNLHGGRMLIAYNKDHIFVVGRGTANLQNWISNFLAYPGFVSDVENNAIIHSGFKRTLDSVWVEFYRKFKKVRAKNQNAKIWAGGHSLGGALSIIAASRLKRRGYEVEGVYTAAMPRMGNDEYRYYIEELFPGRVFHVLRENDMVTHLPPSGEVSLKVAKLFSQVFDKHLLGGVPIDWEKVGVSLKKIDYTQVGIQYYSSPQDTDNLYELSSLEKTHERDVTFWKGASKLALQGSAIEKAIAMSRAARGHSLIESYICPLTDTIKSYFDVKMMPKQKRKKTWKFW